MPSIGETLREARMRRRLDIADVESKTKIRAKYLRALENEEFGLLPGPTFVKTFLRTYAEVLGLDPHPLIEEYRRGYEAREEPEPTQGLAPPAVGRSDRRRRPRLPQPGPATVLILVLVLVVAALAVVGVVFGGGDENGGESADNQATETTGQKQRGKRNRPAGPRRVRLRITPITPTYVCIDRGDGTRVFEGTLDSAETFRGKILRVNLGKTDVQLTSNGRNVPIAPGPEPVGFRFTARSHRTIPPAKRPCV
jgi:cytoskeleton protein RodZ